MTSLDGSLADKNKNLDSYWINYYNQIKDPSWPTVSTCDDILNLPRAVLHEVLFEHKLFTQHTRYQPMDQALDDDELYSSEDLADTDYDNFANFLSSDKLDYPHLFIADQIKIHYHQTLDGGGTEFGIRYPHVLSKLYPNQQFENCFEWCSGPGFIGFDLLSRGLCQNLYFNDIYQPAIDSIKQTIEKNQRICKDRVFYKHSASVGDLPSDWKFDLVVSNPPFWNLNLGQMITRIRGRDKYRRAVDNDWQIHRDFFANIGQHMNDNGIILLQEASNASGPDTFRDMIEQNGMYISNYYWEPRIEKIYYLEIKKA